MGEENRESSGSGTTLLVIGIVAVVLLVPCCGGVVLLGGGWFFARSAAQEMRMEEMEVQDRARQDFEKSSNEMQEAKEKIRQEIEGIKFPDAPPDVPPPEIAPVSEPPAVEEKKE